MTDAREMTLPRPRRPMRRLATIIATLALLSWLVAPTTAANDPGFKTSRPAQLAPLEAGVVIDPILSTGDIIGTYQMSGIPDGLGAYKDGGNTLQVLMNHELGKTFPGMPPGVDARISQLTLNRKTHGVLDATYVFTGVEGFERFCSSTLETINGTPYYFTGEEAINAGHDGSSIVLNADTGAWSETAHFGHFQHENVVPVQRLSKFMVLSQDDDFRAGQPAYMFAYIADSLDAAISGDPAQGSLYVWKALDETVRAGDLDKGETIPGEFVPLTQAENANSTALKAAATAKDAFRFARLEDGAMAQQHPGRHYFVDTGKPGEATVKGRLYRMDIDPSDPTKASLTLLLDGDRGDDMVNPDNIDTSVHSVVIQEDRETANRPPPSRVLVYDIRSGTIRPVATVTGANWESSGVINAHSLLGQGWWLMDVQAHSGRASQPGAGVGPDGQPVPNTGTGEDGQLLAVFIPDS